MKHTIICAIFVFGCGGENDDGSGVDPALPLGTLGPSEIDELCNYGVSLSRTVDCDGIGVESTADLEACIDTLEGLSETCDATVAELETCFDDLTAQTDDEVCGLVAPASCDFFGDPDCLDI